MKPQHSEQPISCRELELVEDALAWGKSMRRWRRIAFFGLGWVAFDLGNALLRWLGL